MLLHMVPLMPLDLSIHRTVLFQILKDIYTDSLAAPFLGFKGGTAAVLFYGLDRFSVDLDFDLLDAEQRGTVFERVLSIVQKRGVLKESHTKRFSLFCRISYEDRARSIKVEVNRRHYGSRYEIKTYLGVSMLVMVIEDMFAHKLVAMSERVGKTSRDIYDIWFFLQNQSPINKEIVESRSGMPFNQFIEKCIIELEKMSNRKILDGVGELFTPGQKDWAKAKLRQETIALLALRKGNQRTGK
jgi:predicted nucleotidyltransferase component of viral defense system